MMSVAEIHGYTSEQVAAAEASSLERGVPLMARAAAGLAAAVRSVLPDDGGVVLVLAGAGNNGADAMYAAAELAGDDLSVAIVATADRAHPDALAAALEAGARLIHAEDAPAVAGAADVVVDGILGTGTSGALRGTARDIVAAVLPELMENQDAYIVAVDIPSGVNPDDGSVPDPLLLPADLTVTFGAYKAGLLLAPGSDFAGEVRLVDIGLDAEYAAMTPAVSVART
jgi:NAD(P)H-hydrate epimerase